MPDWAKDLNETKNRIKASASQLRRGDETERQINVNNNKQTMEETVTFEEYRKEVKEHATLLLCNSAPKERVTAFLNDPEQEKMIRDKYNMLMEKYNGGEITRQIFMGGGVESIVYCLYMCYE